jgi:dihydroorotase-like cyclic amidohydrolase
MLDAWHKGKLSFHRLVDLVSSAPARTFGLESKGSLAPGSDADIVLLDLDREWVIDNDSVLSRIGWTPYDGRSVKGAVNRTMVRGVDVWIDGDVVGTPGHGRLATPNRTES